MVRFRLRKYANRFLVVSTNIEMEKQENFENWVAFSNSKVFIYDVSDAAWNERKKKLRKKLKFHYNIKQLIVCTRSFPHKKKDFNSITTVNGWKKVFFYWLT